jgi:hypothetical protein
VEPLSKPKFIMRLSGGDASHVISEGDSDGDGDSVSVGESTGLEDAKLKQTRAMTQPMVLMIDPWAKMRMVGKVRDLRISYQV